MDAGTYSHRQLDLEGQQFFPYLNQQRVLALFVKARFAYAGGDDRVVPFYLLPQLGGNFELRGFNQYRFSDNNTFMAAIEHRWYAFSGLEMALFLDAGKSVAEKGNVDFSELNYSGGIGLRVRVRDAVLLRMDVATSREGTRWIWSHERRLAETLLVAARRPPAIRARRVLALLAARDRHRSRRGGGAEVLSGRPAGARAGAAARARSRGPQFQRAARGHHDHGEPPGRTASG